MSAPDDPKAPRPTGAEAAENILRGIAAQGPNTVVDGSVALTPEEAKARGKRNLWLALSLTAFIVLVFLITIAKMHANSVIGP